MKKFNVLLIIPVLIFSLQAVCFSSSGEQEGPIVSIGNVTAEKGEIIQVPVTLSNNSGFMSLGIEVSYNSGVMSLISAENEPTIRGSFTPAQELTRNPYNMSWIHTSDVVYNGTIAILTFKINDNAPAGKYPIVIEHYKGPDGTYIDGEDVNGKETDIAPDYWEPLGLQYECGLVEICPDTQATDDIIISDIFYRFTVNVGNTESGGNVIAALYSSDNSLIESKIYPVQPSIEISFDKPGQYVKVMRWDLETLRPLSAARIIGKP